jgi:hypothetical protein
VLRLALAEGRRAHQATTLVHLDLEKAYDRVLRHRLIEGTARRHGWPMATCILKAYTTDTTTSMIFAGREGPRAPVRRGLRQGSVLSPRLWPEYLADTLEPFWASCQANGWGICLEGGDVATSSWLPLVCYADDCVLLAKSPAEAQAMARELGRHLAGVGHRANATKSRWISLGPEGAGIRLSGEPLRRADGMVVLGSWIAAAAEHVPRETEHRRAEAWSKFWTLAPLFRGPAAFWRKAALLQAAVLPVALHGTETCYCTRGTLRAFTVQQTTFLAIMIGPAATRARLRLRSTTWHGAAEWPGPCAKRPGPPPGQPSGTRGCWPGGSGAASTRGTPAAESPTWNAGWSSGVGIDGWAAASTASAADLGAPCGGC